MTDIHERLDRLESLVDRQQRTIEAQSERLDAMAGNGDAPDPAGERGSSSAGVARRTALKAGSLLALLGLGVGTVGADAQGQVGTASDPLRALYTADLVLDAGGSGIRSDGSVSVDVDNDADSTGETFTVTHNAGSGLFRVTEGGPTEVLAGNLAVPSGRSLIDGGGNSHITLNGGGPLGIDRNVRINGSNSIRDASGNSHLTVTDGGPLAVHRTLDATGVMTLLANGSGTALPGTTTDGELRLFDDTDAIDPSGRIQFQANGTTFTVNADAGHTYRDETTFAEAMDQPPLGPDETRCPVTGERFEVGDPIVQLVDQRKRQQRDDREWDEIHAVPLSLGAALDRSETIAEQRARIEDLRSDLEKREARIERVEAENERLRERTEALEARLDAVETRVGPDGTTREVADD
ncbi:MAG: hypothetical protein ABEH78_08720 [Haloferacaceae archaeon]